MAMEGGSYGREAAVTAFPRRIVEAVVEGLETAGRAKHAGRWDAADLTYSAKLVLTRLNWPDSWGDTARWVSDGVTRLAAKTEVG